MSVRAASYLHSAVLNPLVCFHGCCCLCIKTAHSSAYGEITLLSPVRLSGGMCRFYRMRLYMVAVLAACICCVHGAEDQTSTNVIADACRKPHYRLTRNGTSCEKCPTCQIGQGLDKSCGFGEGDGAKCVLCEEGKKFSSESRCWPCTNCSIANKKFKYLCRPEINAKCGECEVNFFNNFPGDACERCQNHSQHDKCVRDRNITETKQNLVSCVTAKEKDTLSQEVITESDKQTENPWKIVAIIAFVVIVIFITREAYHCWRQSRSRSMPVSDLEPPDLVKVDVQQNENSDTTSKNTNKKKKVGYTIEGKSDGEEKARLIDQREVSEESIKSALNTLQTSTEKDTDESDSVQETRPGPAGKHAYNRSGPAGKPAYNRSGPADKPVYNRSMSLPVSSKEKTNVNVKNAGLLQTDNGTPDFSKSTDINHVNLAKPHNADPQRREVKRQFDRRQQAVPDDHSMILPVASGIPASSVIGDHSMIPSLASGIPTTSVTGAYSMIPPVASGIATSSMIGAHSMIPPVASGVVTSSVIGAHSMIPPVVSGVVTSSMIGGHSMIPPEASRIPVSSMPGSNPLHSGLNLSSVPSRLNPPVENADDRGLPSEQLVYSRENRNTTRTQGGASFPIQHYPSSSAGRDAVSHGHTCSCRHCPLNRQNGLDQATSEAELLERWFREAIRHIGDDALVSKIPQDLRDLLSLRLTENKDLHGDKNFRHVAERLGFERVLFNALNGMADLFKLLDRKRKTVRDLMQAVKDIGRLDALQDLIDWVQSDYRESSEATRYGVKETGDGNKTMAIPTPTDDVKIL